VREKTLPRSVARRSGGERERVYTILPNGAQNLCFRYLREKRVERERKEEKKHYRHCFRGKGRTVVENTGQSLFGGRKPKGKIAGGRGVALPEEFSWRKLGGGGKKEGGGTASREMRGWGVRGGSMKKDVGQKEILHEEATKKATR